MRNNPNLNHTFKHRALMPCYHLACQSIGQAVPRTRLANPNLTSYHKRKTHATSCFESFWFKARMI
jgi:hypothetical protein